jgi:hypothetical protein
LLLPPLPLDGAPEPDAPDAPDAPDDAPLGWVDESAPAPAPAPCANATEDTDAMSTNDSDRIVDFNVMSISLRL